MCQFLSGSGAADMKPICVKLHRGSDAAYMQLICVNFSSGSAAAYTTPYVSFYYRGAARRICVNLYQGAPHIAPYVSKFSPESDAAYTTPYVSFYYRGAARP